MAPPGDVYFPSLEKCFSGQAVVLSWTDLFEELFRHGTNTNSDMYTVLLSADSVKSILSHPIPKFPKPSSQAKSDFEARTAVINVTPTQDAHYNLNEIKEDSLWLSNTANLNEVEALRIVVNEWQQRPAAHLQEGLTEPELASLSDALVSDNYSCSARKADGQDAGATSDVSFASKDRRRTRLLTLWTKAKTSIIGVRRVLLEIAIKSLDPSRYGLTLGSDPSITESSGTNIEKLAQSLTLRKRPEGQNDHEDLVDVIDDFQTAVDDLSKGPRWSGNDFSANSEDLRNQWAYSSLEELNFRLELILLRVRGAHVPLHSDVVLKWIKTAMKYNFFVEFELCAEEQIPLRDTMQALSTIITLGVLDPAVAMESIESVADRPDVPANRTINSPYFLNVESVGEIHELLFSLADGFVIPASPATLAWALILCVIRDVAITTKDARESSAIQKAIEQGGTRDPQGRRLSSSSTSSIQQTLLEDIMETIRVVSHVDDDIEVLLQFAIDGCQVFDYVTSLCSLPSPAGSLITYTRAAILQELVTISAGPVGYSISVLSAQLSILDSAYSEGGPSGAKHDSAQDPPRLCFLSDDEAVSTIFDVAAARFPYEMLPFLQLCSSLTTADQFDIDGNHYITHRLRGLSTFTQVATPAFSAYHTTREYENANLVSLEHSVGMFDGIEQRLLEFGGHPSQSVYCIPSDAIGEVISDGRPPVIKWLHSYSGLGYLGYWLDNFRFGRAQDFTSDYVDADAAAAISMEVLASLISSTLNAPSISASKRYENSVELLEEIGNGLTADADLVVVVFEIFEQQLQQLRTRKRASDSCQILVGCLRLIKAILHVEPGRIWSALSRSSLVDLRGSYGTMLSIVWAIETPAESYSFFENCVLLYQALIEDAIRQAVLLEQAGTLGRRVVFDATEVGGVPNHIANEILLAFTRVMVDAFQSSPTWKFDSRAQRYRIGRNICDSFISVIQYTYGADDTPSLSKKLTASLASSAEHIAENLRPPLTDMSGPTSCLQWLLLSWEDSRNQTTPNLTTPLSNLAGSSIALTTILLRVRVLLERPQSALESQILNAFPILVRLLSSNTECRPQMMKLMQALLQSLPTENTPSLLGHLGSISSTNFLEIVGDTIRQSQDESLIRAGWDFLTALVSKSQQWFAIVLLTGCSPKDTFRRAEETSGLQVKLVLRGKSILAEALDRLSNIGDLDPQQAIAILEFVVNSQIYWTWATNTLQTNTTLLPSLTSCVSKMTVDNNDTLGQSYANKIASLVVELATVHLHYARAMKDLPMIQKMIPIMRWLRVNAIDVSGYNTSLHSNLRKNFTARYGTCTLANFKRTLLVKSPYGKSYFYDLELATKMLSRSDYKSKRPDFEKTFSQEIVRANLNFSLVDSQMALLDSFRTFCVEHCAFFTEDREAQKIMSNIVQTCLMANSRTLPSEKIFDSLCQNRADFSLALIQRLALSKARGSEFTALLDTAWEAVRAGSSTYEDAIVNNELRYFRTMLSNILFALQFHANKKQKTVEPERKAALLAVQPHSSSSTVLEVTLAIIANGMRSVVTAIHDQASNPRQTEEQALSEKVDSKDVSLLLTCFQTILRFATLPQMVAQISSYFISVNTIQSSLLLYSWGHVLEAPESNNDLIYADLSTRFLASLSSLTPVAEELAVECVLSRISTSRTTMILRSAKNGVSQFDKRPRHAALYGVWTAGILPLCLNLLHHVGRTMAGEVAEFLNSFPQQLSNAATAFATGNHNWASNPLTLTVANEAATLALISRILISYRSAGASAGVNALEVPPLEGYEDLKGSLAEDIDEMISLGGKASKLNVRFVATCEKEMGMQKGKSKGESDGLQQAIIGELRNALVCLRGVEDDSAGGVDWL